jgi:arabinan endo-1,5-alpha-L-arabinosidase
MKYYFYITWVMLMIATNVFAQGHNTKDYKGKTFQKPFVHDPVMAVENGITYIYATGAGIDELSSADGINYKAGGRVLKNIPAWTHDSVPEFKQHVWAPDVIKYHDKWYMAYSCSSFGKNTSAIGLLSNKHLANKNEWKDEGCIIASQGGRDDWNAIDPNFVIDENDTPWLVFGSFWDGIQLVKLDKTMHVAKGEKPRTIARRFAFNIREVPESEGGPKKLTPGNYSLNAGQNAIEAPFILKHNGYYYLFVSWDYCCMGAKSSYRVVVGRSRNIEGPYLDNRGIDMLNGGGLPVIEGDKKTYEAAGHCAAYTIDDNDVFICHGYDVALDGASVLIKKNIKWDNDGWPVL